MFDHLPDINFFYIRLLKRHHEGGGIFYVNVMARTTMRLSAPKSISSKNLIQFLEPDCFWIVSDLLQ